MGRSGGAGAGGVLGIMHGRSRMNIDPRISLLCRDGHVGFSSTRQTLFAPSVKRREMLGESHEW